MLFAMGYACTLYRVVLSNTLRMAFLILLGLSPIFSFNAAKGIVAEKRMCQSYLSKAKLLASCTCGEDVTVSALTVRGYKYFSV